MKHRIYLHEETAAKGNKHHKGPLGNDAETPHDIAKGNRQAELSQLAVEGVEIRVQEDVALAVVLVVVHDALRGNAGQVLAGSVDVDDGRGRQHVDGPDGADASRPAVAENGFVVAVEESHVRSLGENSKLAGGLVEGLFGLAAVTYRSRRLAYELKGSELNAPYHSKSCCHQ